MRSMLVSLAVAVPGPAVAAPAVGLAASRRLVWMAVGASLLAAGPVAAATPGRITGVGGVFVKSKDPKALRAWYRDVLGLEIQPWGGAMLRYDAPDHPPVLVWNALRDTSDYMAPSTRDFMLDLAVDDMDAIIRRLQAKGVKILKTDDSDPDGRFAWILDPDGVKIELWQAKARPGRRANP